MTRLKVVSNAGPLIYLAVVGRILLLKDLFSEIYLSKAVYDEVVLQGAGQPGADETLTAVKAGWLRRVAVSNQNLSRLVSRVDCKVIQNIGKCDFDAGTT